MIDTQVKYTKVRSLSEVLSASFNYFKFNSKSISTILLYYVYPFFIASMLFSFYFEGPHIYLTNIISCIKNVFTDKAIEAAMIIVLYFFGLALQNQLLNKHLILNEELNSDNTLEASEFKLTVVPDFIGSFSNIFFLSLTIIIITLVLKAILGQLFNEPYTTGFMDDPITFIIESIPQIIYFLVIIPFTCYFIVTALFFAQRDKTGIFESLQKVWDYTRENIFNTWITAVIAFMLAYALKTLLLFPFYIIGFAQGSFEAPSLISVHIFTIFFGLFAVTTFQLICVFHLTSLEEKKEGSIIKQKIDNL